MKIKPFESGIANIHSSKKRELIRCKVSGIGLLKQEKNAELWVEGLSTIISSCTHLVLKVMCTANEKMGSSYRDLSFIVPTSDVCGRLFSKIGYTLNNF